LRFGQSIEAAGPIRLRVSHDCPKGSVWHTRTVPTRTVPRALLLAAAIACSVPGAAHAYDRQLTLDVAAGWGVAPVLEAPNHGPGGGIGASFGFDDAWGLGVYTGWFVHPPFNGGEAVHLGVFGVEGLYYLDILQVVPFFGLGIDVLPAFDGATGEWSADFAAHVRASLDYLVSREVIIGIDIRPYVLFTSLSIDPVYITFLARFSYVLDY
jgi:hypothetical protein